MRIEKIGLEVEGIRTKVYDVDKKELLGTFESRSQAAKFTGLSTSRMLKYIREKSVHYSKTLNKRVCFR